MTDIRDRLDDIACRLLDMDSESGEGRTLTAAGWYIGLLRTSARRYQAAIKNLTALRGPNYTYMDANVQKDSAALAAWQELDAAGKALREVLAADGDPANWHARTETP